VSKLTNSDNTAKISAPRPDTSGRRSALAAWLTDPSHPLTTRVIVNRIWQGHFGKGLVSNANDLGMQTPPPVHPELLDWLATEFVRQGWSIKSLHRLILNSTVFQQSTLQDNANEDKAEQLDPGNELYWHFPRQRLKAENIRDSMLDVAGLLNTKMYGKGTLPELPPNLNARSAWKPAEDKSSYLRRSVYIHAKRNLPYPLLKVFDLPDMHESCARRAETTVAPQALMLLNSGMIIRYARSFAERLLADHNSADLTPLIEQAFVTAFARKPTQSEIFESTQFLEQQKTLISQNKQKQKTDFLPTNLPTEFDQNLAVAIVDFCHILLNANEFIYID